MKLLLSLKNNQLIIKDCKFFAVFFCDRMQKIQDEKKCILRSVTDVDAFQSGRFAKQNGRPETQKFLLTLSV